MKPRQLRLFAVGVLCIACALAGCESLGKKFIRKKPKQEGPVEGMVARPEEYPGGGSREDRYAKSFLYWKSWFGEFIDSLQEKNHKRQVETFNEALKNLMDIRGLVDEERARKLDGRVKQLEQLRAQFASDIYFARASDNAREAEKIERGIMTDLGGAH
jgi:hypothetical protein